MSIVYHSPAGDMWLCYTCGKYYHSMMGDKCDKCCAEERKQKEEDKKTRTAYQGIAGNIKTTGGHTLTQFSRLTGRPRRRGNSNTITINQ